MKAISLCSGYGGLDIACHALWPDVETTTLVDIDSNARTVLAARFPSATILDDLTTIDWTTIDADLLTAGFPCQPVSTAGRRKGQADARWLWDHIAEGIGVVEPSIVVLENVRGLLSADGGRAFGQVIGRLASMGYVGRYGVLRAADAGAPHKRERVFVVAALPGSPHAWRVLG